MKKYIISIFAALLALGVTSCNKFLDEMPDNRTELDNEEKITRLLTSAYPDGTYQLFTNFMDDNYDDIGESSTSITAGNVATAAWHWRDIPEEGNDNPKVVWEKFYLAIAHANQALQAIEELGNPEHLDPQRGEALMARAWAHFKLVNIFCQNYSEAHAGTDLGVPYMEAPETEVDPVYTRGTVKEVYEKIARDIEEGLPLIDDNIYTVPKYHFNRLAAYGFASEFYLFYKNYDKCIEYANVVLGEYPENMMRNLTQYTSIPDGEPKWRFYIDPTVNANLLLMTNYSSVGPSCTPLFVADSRFTNVDYCAFHENLYSVSVLWNPNAVSAAERQSCFLMRPGRWLPGGVAAAAGRYSVPYLFEYTDPVAGIGYVHSVLAMVSADNVLLMRAEANVLKENYAAAMEDINRWVKMRMTAQWASPKTENQLVEYYGGLPYYTSTAPTVKKRMTPETPFTSDRQEAFIHAILHLRRIEFIFEGSRWFDIKRYNIEITRRKVKETDYTTLDPDSVEEIDKLGVRDLRMAIQLPEGPISRGMTPNPR